MNSKFVSSSFSRFLNEFEMNNDFFRDRGGHPLDLARNFSVDQAESFSNKDKQAIIGMISKFSNGGSAAFERRMVTVVHDIVFEKTGHAIGGRRRLLPKAYSMGDIAQKSKAPKSNAVDEAVYPVRV